MNTGIRQTLTQNTRIYGKMIKFTHSIFALPFALSAVVLAWETYPPSVWDLGWILAAMVTARSAAMGFNRIVDAAIDKQNPRTACREIPSGALALKDAIFFVCMSGIGFIVSAAMLSPTCFFLSFPVLFALCFYSYTKRFTPYCHLYLGFAIGLAPIGAWVAVTHTLAPGAVFMAVALWTWMAGFDILYACQDMAFDNAQGLFSLPAVLGPHNAMRVSSVCHMMTMGFFMAMFFAFSMHPVFLVFLTAIGAALWIEHRLVDPDDLSRVNMAFFRMNAVVSVLLFVGVLVETALR